MVRMTSVACALIFGAGLCLAQGRCGSMSPFVEGPVSERLVRLAELHAAGKRAIAMLVREVASSERAPVTLENPYLSNRPVLSQTHCGIVAAYLIELILGKAALSLREFLQHGAWLIQGAPDNYIYRLGYIAHVSSGEAIDKSALSNVAKLYAEWWRNSADSSLDDLREHWRKGDRPLTGSGYKWQ